MIKMLNWTSKSGILLFFQFCFFFSEILVKSKNNGGYILPPLDSPFPICIVGLLIKNRYLVASHDVM